MYFLLYETMYFSLYDTMYNENISCSFIREYIKTTNISVIQESVYRVIHYSVFLIIRDDV